MNTSSPTPSTMAKAGRKVDEFIRTTGWAVLLAMLIRMLVFEPFSIPSSSMVPTLLIGDFLYVSKYSYGYSSRSTVLGLLPIPGRAFFTEPKRGDVVVFKVPSDNRTDYIKRLVGLPGDTIQVRNGLLYVNGVAVDRQKLDEPVAWRYLRPPPESHDYIETFPDTKRVHVIRELGDDYQLDNTYVFTVPPRHYFMMGDNRDNSQDSRTPTVGFVPEENLVGRAERIFFSLDEQAHVWEIWKWPWAVRWSRLFTKIE